VDPDVGVEQDVVAQLAEQRAGVREAVQVRGEGQEVLQNAAGQVGARRLVGEEEEEETFTLKANLT